MLSQKSRPTVSSDSPAAFSLVELFLSMGVLSIILTIVVMIIDGTTRATNRSAAQRDSDNQARLVFGRIAMDLAGIVQRPDLDALFEKRPGDDRFFCYSRVLGYGAGRRLSLVGYEVDSSSQLRRLGQGLDQIGFLPEHILDRFPEVQAGTSPCFDPLGEKVFRLEFALKLKPDSTHQNSFYSGTIPDGGWNEVSGLSVGIAVLDGAAAAKLPSGSTAEFARLLPDAAITDTEPGILKVWRQALKPEANGSAAPQAFIQNVSIYLREFALRP